MRDDTKQELERLERELLPPEDQQSEEDLLADLKGILGEETAVEPAFDDPQTIHTPKEPMVYTNFANGYGRKSAEETPEEAPKKKRKPEKLTLGLLITACLLTLGIIGVLLYWLLFLLR
jgi:hypothetical protein